MSKGSSHVAILGALASNLAVAITKFIAASITGSSAMISEGIHSVVDAANTLLLLIGARRSEKAPTQLHPFGYGKEIYFWTLVVAVSLFAIGGGMSIYEGIHHITDPEPITDPTWNYVVLGLSILFTGLSWIIAFKEFTKNKKEDSILKALKNSKDPGIFAILAEDTADILGLLIAFLGVFLSHALNNPIIDGIASIVIGVILTSTSLLLAYKSKGLLIGESADELLLYNVVRITEKDPSVIKVNTPLTMHMGPSNILVALGISFDQTLNSSEVATAIDRLEQKIRSEHPEIKKLFIEAKSITFFKNDPVTK